MPDFVIKVLLSVMASLFDEDIAHNFESGPTKYHLSSGLREDLKCDLVSKYA